MSLFDCMLMQTVSDIDIDDNDDGHVLVSKDDYTFIDVSE